MTEAERAAARAERDAERAHGGAHGRRDGGQAAAARQGLRQQAAGDGGAARRVGEPEDHRDAGGARSPASAARDQNVSGEDPSTASSLLCRIRRGENGNLIAGTEDGTELQIMPLEDGGFEVHHPKCRRVRHRRDEDPRYPPFQSQTERPKDHPDAKDRYPRRGAAWIHGKRCRARPQGAPGARCTCP